MIGNNRMQSMLVNSFELIANYVCYKALKIGKEGIDFNES